MRHSGIWPAASPTAPATAGSLSVASQRGAGSQEHNALLTLSCASFLPLTIYCLDAGSEGCVPKLSASLQSLAAPLSRLKGLGDLALQDLGLTASLPAEWASPGGLLRWDGSKASTAVKLVLRFPSAGCDPHAHPCVQPLASAGFL